MVIYEIYKWCDALKVLHHLYIYIAVKDVLPIITVR